MKRSVECIREESEHVLNKLFIKTTIMTDHSIDLVIK